MSKEEDEDQFDTNPRSISSIIQQDSQQDLTKPTNFRSSVRIIMEEDIPSTVQLPNPSQGEGIQQDQDKPSALADAANGTGQPSTCLRKNFHESMKAVTPSNTSISPEIIKPRGSSDSSTKNFVSPLDVHPSQHEECINALRSNHQNSHTSTNLPKIIESDALETSNDDMDMSPPPSPRPSYLSEGPLQNQTPHALATRRARNELAARESRLVNCFRVLLIVTLFATTLLIAVLVYNYTANRLNEDFETTFEAHRILVTDHAEESMAKKLEVLDGLAVSVMIDGQGRFPNVTVSGWEVKAANTRVMEEGIMIYWLPLVTNETRSGWVEYTKEQEGHLLESFAVEEELRRIQDERDGFARRKMFSIYEELPQEDIWGPWSDSDGPFLPIWQMSPVLPMPSLINLNLYGSDFAPGAYQTVIETGDAAIDVMSGGKEPVTQKEILAAQTIDAFLKLGQYRHDSESYQNDWLSTVVYPVFNSSMENKKVVGVLSSSMYWRLILDNVLPDSVVGVNCVVKNTMNQTITYRVDGPVATYLGEGDLHDPKYDDLVGCVDTITNDEISHTKSYTAVRLNSEYISYSLCVYPSDETKEMHISNKPAIYTAVVVVIFLLTSLAFVIFDVFVRKRQKIILDRAVKASVFLERLYPAQVRDRLFNGSLHELHRHSMASIPERNTEPDGDDGDDGYDGYFKGNPIADDFPNTTVLFADLAGFTAWSSSRKPEDVFYLLETLYHQFDTIAERRGVFKVETIGDCYMAVTGLPDPQEDHAVIMAKFAMGCIKAMKDTLEIMKDEFGEMNLELRVGMHSGHVTGGVLRGEKTRFQLFGDTVNTASRMESNGMKGLIHCSQSTADELEMAGYGKWLTPREDKVVAKGKGEMQTYWVGRNPGQQGTSKQSQSSSVEDVEEELLEDESSLQPPEIKENMNERRRKLIKMMSAKSSMRHLDAFDIDTPSQQPKESMEHRRKKLIRRMSVQSTQRNFHLAKATSLTSMPEADERRPSRRRGVSSELSASCLY